MNKFAICCNRLERLGGSSEFDLARRLLKRVYNHCPTIDIPDISLFEERVCVIDWEENTCIHIGPYGLITTWDSWSYNDLDTVAQMIVERLAPMVVFKPKSELDELIERIVNTKLSDLEERVKNIEIEIRELKTSLGGNE